MSDAELLKMEPKEETPPQETPPEPPKEQALNVEDDAAVDAVLGQGVIETPDGGKLHDGEQVGKVAQSYRQQIKVLKEEIATLKSGSAESERLKGEVAQLQGHLNQLMPYAQAGYQAHQQANQPRQPTPQEEIPDHVAERVARQYDLYDGTGKYDLERGRAIALDMRQTAREEARRAAEEAVRPLQQQTAQQAAATVYHQVKATLRGQGVTEEALSDQMIQEAFGRIPPEQASQPGVGQWLVSALAGAAMLSGKWQPGKTPTGRQRDASGRFTQQAQEPVPPPIEREMSGGHDTPNASPLSEAEKRYIQQAGITEADYLKAAAPRFGGR